VLGFFLVVGVMSSFSFHAKDHSGPYSKWGSRFGRSICALPGVVIGFSLGAFISKKLALIGAGLSFAGLYKVMQMYKVFSQSGDHLSDVETFLNNLTGKYRVAIENVCSAIEKHPHNCNKKNCVKEAIIFQRKAIGGFYYDILMHRYKIKHKIKESDLTEDQKKRFIYCKKVFSEVEKQTKMTLSSIKNASQEKQNKELIKFCRKMKELKKTV